MKINKRSQEEMIGLVLIIVLVSIVALVFLAISLRKPGDMKTSAEVTNFLQSSLQLTTNCSPSPEIIYTIPDLIEACYGGEDCSGINSCDMLNSTFFGLVDAGFGLKDSQYKGYDFSVRVLNQSLISIKSGNSTSYMVGDEVALLGMDNAKIMLKVFIGS